AGPRSGEPPKPFDNLVPVLDTSLCLIESGCLYYRGADAMALAESADLEAVAHLLWAHDGDEPFHIGALRPDLRKLLANARLLPTAMDRARTLLAQLALHDVAAL